jgi:hypothetical protein
MSSTSSAVVGPIEIDIGVLVIGGDPDVRFSIESRAPGRDPRRSGLRGSAATAPPASLSA